VPLLNRGELVGVLCIERELPYRFHEEDKVSMVATHTLHFAAETRRRGDAEDSNSTHAAT